MGFRFRKRIKIIPALWVNLSKSGMSTSIGGKGLTVNLKGDKTKTTASIPGTGLSYSRQTSRGPNAMPSGRRAIPAWAWLLIFVVVALLLTAK